LTGSIWARCAADEASIKKTFYEIDDWKQTVCEMVTTTLAQQIGQMTRDEVLEKREETARRIQSNVNEPSKNKRVVISKITLT
jgi:regulator of protease activity HflC (stomatin/prohibitin superfamily)